MNVKIICGKVYGADLTVKEREALEIEARKEIARQARIFSNYFDGSILWQIHKQYGKGKKALREFFDGWKVVHKSLIDHYEMEDKDAPWLFNEKLKEIGVDVEAWNAEDDE